MATRPCELAFARVGPAQNSAPDVSLLWCDHSEGVGENGFIHASNFAVLMLT